MKHIIDDNTIWEDTGRIIVYNYPANPSTYSYIVKIYKEYKKIGSRLLIKDIEGDVIYFHDLTSEMAALARIIAEAEYALNSLIPLNKDLAKLQIDE